MKIQLSNKGRAIIAVILFLFSIIVFGMIIAPAGFSISESGKEMSRLRSVGGNTVAEAYYQLHGEIYEALGNIIGCLGVVLCIGGCLISGVFLKPIYKSNKNRIDTIADDVKGRVSRASQELSKPTVIESDVLQEDCNSANNTDCEFTRVNSVKSTNEFKCTNCGTPLPEDSQFCTKCGTEISNRNDEQKKCPSCGKPLASDSAFCTKCGCKIG